MVAIAVCATTQFIFIFLCLFINPRIILLLAYVGAITFTALIMGLNLPSVNRTAALSLVIVIFDTPIFPLVFAIGLRGLSR
jgi:hypothetical protein